MPLIDSRYLDQTFATGRKLAREAVGDGLLVQRARRALGAHDRLLVELAYARHLSLRQMATIMGRPAGSLSRRLRRLRKTLRDPIVEALIDPACVLTPEYRQVGLEYFAQGREIRELAKDRRMTPTQIKAVVNFVRGWCRGVRRLGDNSQLTIHNSQKSSNNQEPNLKQNPIYEIQTQRMQPVSV
jgi:hypothetical protein